MQTRREFIGTAALSFGVSTASMIPAPAMAQTIPDLSPVFDGKIANDMGFFVRLRLLSATLIDLRISYAGPFGYEDTAWGRRAFDAWRRAYGRSPDDGFASASSKIETYDQLNAQFDIAKQMDAKLSQQLPRFADWLSGVGVTPNSILFNDLILGQAGMAVLLAAVEPAVEQEGQMSFFDSESWIYPFCGYD